MLNLDRSTISNKSHSEAGSILLQVSDTLLQILCHILEIQ